MKHSKKIAAGALTAMLAVTYATMPSKDRVEYVRNPAAQKSNMQKFKKKKFHSKPVTESTGEEL